jgi:hypothetical protein
MSPLYLALFPLPLLVLLPLYVQALTLTLTLTLTMHAPRSRSVLNKTLDWNAATSASSNLGGATQGDITAFQHWKMENFLWAPDTPEASKHFDRWAGKVDQAIAIDECRHVPLMQL